jgi:hypothetical protein
VVRIPLLLNSLTIFLPSRFDTVLAAAVVLHRKHCPGVHCRLLPHPPLLHAVSRVMTRCLTCTLNRCVKVQEHLRHPLSIRAHFARRTSLRAGIYNSLIFWQLSGYLMGVIPLLTGSGNLADVCTVHRGSQPNLTLVI